ncbi:methylmalonyl Co-A mutase-associated GTPase MeaB [Aurantiacibacter rhizosphaerae]|uniref:Methylmalonyl Co-A mutase-associated GTPase MeaB n=1 Tax=Aurantiacibacter rhizosphaerae TaxID=2691582 RepID=A0A844XFN4_9SPHN|nr:methylmalonyl Co-A mutase-associated GTPase MeaB [Aurantiacibacter rhizosphaerae]MWV29297.1 methylmalonyl Co-A mutase-associated GTPase MeaB [Aurantiacibacter rhizosphaerae]
MGELADSILAGDRRAAGRLISQAERRDPQAVEDLGILYRHGGHARTIGITGPPGAGKSTVADALITRFRKLGQTVAIIAVDPSSPISSGAVLGDRVRMMRHCDDEGVLVRSMATRGALGGLSAATGDAITVFDAMGFDIIIIETVGVGQSETDIVGHSEAVILLQTALGGDGVQAIKAGVLEIADLIVVNKKSTSGSDKMARFLRESLHDRPMRADGWDVPVLLTEASEDIGIDKLTDTLVQRFYHNSTQDRVSVTRRRQVAAHLTALADVEVRSLTKRLVAGDATPEAWQAVLERRSDPWTLSAQLFEKLR